MNDRFAEIYGITPSTAIAAISMTAFSASRSLIPTSRNGLMLTWRGWDGEPYLPVEMAASIPPPASVTQMWNWFLTTRCSFGATTSIPR